MKRILNQLVGFVKEVHSVGRQFREDIRSLGFRQFREDVRFVGFRKYWKGFRPATRVLKHREELYPKSGGISTQAMVLGELDRQMRRFEEDCSEAITMNHRSRRIEAIIASQPGNRRRYPHKELITA